MLNFQYPPPKQNALIALVCPASPALSETEPAAARDYLQNKYALNVIYREDTYQSLSATQKADIFLEYLFNPEIKLLWALRGGEGSADILPFLEKHKNDIQKLAPKLILGFSDITALLVYFQQQYSWPVIHGIGAMQLVGNKIEEYSKKLTLNILEGKTTEVSLDNLTPLNQVANANKEIQGTLTGGNLSLLAISIKDCWELNADNKILMIEDVHEKAHKISRTLKYLQRIGKFAKTKAIILGDFQGAAIGCTEQEIKENAKAIDEVLVEFAKTCDFPVLATSLFGHGKINYPLPFGTPAQTKDTAGTAKLIITSPVNKIGYSSSGNA